MPVNTSTSKPKGIGMGAALLTILFILVLTLAPAPTNMQELVNVQPELLTIAAEQPDSTVRVIIQESIAQTNVEETITTLGGKVIQDLHFIQAVAAELPANAVLDIAYMANVKWISLDRPLMTAEVEGGVSIYLQTNPFPANDNTGSQAILPLSTIPPTATELFNFDTNRDDFPGLYVAKGGNHHIESDHKKIQRWRLATSSGDLQLNSEAVLTVFAAMKDFQAGKTGILRAYLMDWDGSQAHLIATNTGSKSSWNGSWQPLIINFGLLDYTIPAGHQLELVLLVDSDSDDDMWLAYGTETYPSNITIGQVDLIQSPDEEEQSLTKALAEPIPLQVAIEPVPTNPTLTDPIVTEPAPYDPAPTDSEPQPIDTNGSTLNHYLNTLNLQPVWEKGFQGQGVTVAVIDSGISPSMDFDDRLIAQVAFNADAQSPNDSYGHGTHVAGIIGGNGANSYGFYQGVAPQVNLIGLKVSDDNGMAYESDTVAAMQWVFENKDIYNIRVVNLSLNSTVEQSYHTSPFDLSSELLWFNGVVVVASAGNRSFDGNFYTITASPANDPFIITVGASTEEDTDEIKDDNIALFSAHGTTVDGFFKPDVIAPGYNIVSVLSNDSDWGSENPDRLEGNGGYFRLSGTSMAAPMVSGAAALLLQAEPDLTPDQVKYRLMNTGNTITPHWFDAFLDQREYPYLEVYAAISATTTEAANQDVMPHMSLAQMALIAYWANQNGNETIDWNNIDWSAVNWDNVDWDAVDWDVVDWGSVNWGSVNWGSVNWGSVNWGSVNWGSVNWGSVNWGSVNWGSVNWGSVNWGSVSWDD